MCPNCGGPLGGSQALAVGPCSCWKDRLTPNQRVAAQLANLAKHLADVEVRQARRDREAFKRRQLERVDAPPVLRGGFGNRRAAKEKIA